MKDNFNVNSSSTEKTYTIEDKGIRVIKSFAFLPKGWDYGEGEEISSYIIQKAIKVFESFKEFNLNYEITPYSDNSIQITYYLVEEFFDILITESKLSFKHERGVGQIFEIIENYENISIERIKLLIDQKINICISLEPYTLTSLAEVKRDLIGVSVITMEESLSLKRNVPNPRVEQFVHTLASITPPPLVCQ